MIQRMSRRTFLARAAAATTALSALGLSACGARPAPTLELTPKTEETARLTPEQWRTLAAAQALMLPSKPGSPGAVEVHATAYLDAALAEAQMDPEEREMIKAGLGQLDAQAKIQGAAHFAALAPNAQTQTLTEFFAKTETRWFGVVMAFTMEAFLGDPTHGGNPDGVGWAFVGHPAPYPRPVAPPQMAQKLRDQP